MPFEDELNEIDLEYYNTLEIDNFFEFEPRQYAQNSITATPFINVLHMNIRSINKNFEEFLCYLNKSKVKFQIIVLTETWINDNNHCNYHIEGYRTVSKIGSYSRNDGVCVFIDNDIEAALVEDKIENSSSIFIDFKVDSKNFKLIAIYRSPSLNVFDFINSLDSVLTNMDKNKNIIMVGDINLNILEDGNESNEYLSVMHLNGFKSFINKPTRESGESSTCIDHIFYKNFNANNNGGIIATILKTAITDHYCTSIHISHNNLKQTNNANINKTKAIINYTNLSSSLELETWNNIFSSNSNDVNNLTENFIETLNDHIKNNTKKIKISHRKTPLKSWMTEGILNCIRTRDKMHSKLIKEPFNNRLKEEYKKYRNNLNKLIRQTKINYFDIKFDEAKGNNKKTWNYIREIIGVNKERKIPNLDPSALNSHFVNVGRNYANKILNDDRQNAAEIFPPPLSEPPVNSCFIHPTNVMEIKKVICTLGSSSSPGYDEITGTCLKKISNFIAHPLEFIFNKCFLLGLFPEDFKVAVIKPIPKSADLSKPENYRPISLLSNLSKIMEKIIKIRILDFLNRNNFIEKFQYGFQAGKSTKNAILQLTEIINRNFNDNKKTLTVFLDLAKAFDTIPHRILLNKLENCGIRGTAQNLFSSYLTNRKQILTLNSITDVKYTSEFGLPQGTVLSPLLFLIYVNDLFKLDIPNCNIVSFADDTALIFTGESWNEAYDNANIGLSITNHWLRSHILTLNVDKTKFIAFSPNNSGQPANRFSLKMHNHNGFPDNCTCKTIEKVETMKYLGIIIDQNLKWNAHILHLCSKLKYLTYIFYKINKIKHTSIIRNIYFAYAHSLFQYSIEAWGAAHDTHFNKIFVLQKHIIRAALGRPRMYPSRLIFEEIDLPTLRQSYVTNAILYINKNKHKFTARVTPYQIRPTVSNTYNITFTRLTACRHQLPYYCNKLINTLPAKFIENKITRKLINEIKNWVRDRVYFSLEIFDGVVNAL